jgi:Ribonuclease HII
MRRPPLPAMSRRRLRCQRGDHGGQLGEDQQFGRPGVVANDPAAATPCIGADESGKGDYFGPLVSAAVFADSDCVERLTAIGVQDCKQLSDSRVRELAPQVRAAVGTRGYKLTQLRPERYNARYANFSAQGRNLNHMLAWAHARSVEDVLLMGARPQEIVVDQFADVRHISTVCWSRRGRWRVPSSSPTGAGHDTPVVSRFGLPQALKLRRTIARTARRSLTNRGLASVAPGLRRP